MSENEDRLESESQQEPWQLVIVRGSNEYVLHDHTGIPIVIEDSEDDELDSHQRLLWEIMEYFGFAGSKHDPERLRITREKKEE